MSWLIGILIVGWLVLFVPMALLPLLSGDDVELTAPATRPDTADGPGLPPTALRHAPHTPAVEPAPAPPSRRRAA